MAGGKIIIIGAGLAGLSTGCYAQMNGFASHIFEHHAVPGGVAAAWKRGDYLIDGGIHFLMGHKPGTALHRVLKDLGASDPALYLDMDSYGRFRHEESGIDLSVGSDLDKLAADLKTLAPEDGRAIDEIINGAGSMQCHDLSAFGMSHPPELTSRFSRLKDLWQMRSLLRYFGGHYSRKISDFAADLKTPWLKDFFCSLFLPESPAWFIMMILATIFNLLEGRYVDGRIKKRHETWAISRPLLAVSYGLARQFLQDKPFTTVMLADPVAIGNEKVKALFIRILNYGSGFAPAGKTVLQVEIETVFDYWNKLQAEDRAAYDRENKRVAGEMLSRIERYYPGLSSQVELTDVSTPYTTWRYTLNRGGAWGAWLMTSDMINERIGRKLPGLGNFYMAGQWVMCGGVPPSLFSGRHAVQLICHDEGRRFVSGGG